MKNKDIEKAAYEYINSDKVKPENMQQAFGDFINGAKWALSNQWVNVEDRLPYPEPDSECDDGDFVFVMIEIDDETSIIKTDYINYKGEWALNSESKITYWMPIPLIKTEEL